MKADRPSATATVIAAATVLLAHDARAADLVPPHAADWCRHLLSTTAAGRMLCASATHAPTRAIWRMVERATMPGIVEHYWYRKTWIETRCREALAAGAQRVIIVGAGFDTLALRLSCEFTTVEWIEVDHPATQAAKRRALEGPLPAALEAIRRHAARIDFVAADLASEPLPAVLHDSPVATFVVMEGLLMYLEPARVEALLRQLRGLTLTDVSTVVLPNVQTVFSFMERGPDGRTGFRPHSRLIDAWLSWRREPFRWAADPAAMQSWLGTMGLRLVAIESPPFGGQWRGATQLQGESLVHCVISEATPKARSPAP